MKFGYFNDDLKEYIITTPKTPLPWINYLGHNEFFSLISNTAGGYCFYKDAKLRRILRYRYNNVPADNSGRHTYIVDGDSCFSPAFLPLKTNLDSYECHHGLGYTKFVSTKNNLWCEQTFFVPNNDNCEIMVLKLVNNACEPKNIKIFQQVEFCLWNAQDDSSNFQRNFSTGEVEIANKVIYHKTEYRERRNHYAFYAVNEEPVGFDTDRDKFLGTFNGYDNPDVLRNGCNNSVASGWAPCACFENVISLMPNEEKVLIYVLGYIENNEEDKWEKPSVINKEKAHQLINKYANYNAVLEELASLKAYWEELLSHFSVKTPENKFDRMINIWNQYQSMVTFNLSRSASYYESGIGRGMGFRDSCQDLLGFVHMIPERARQRILDIASIQFLDGSTYHQYQPLDKKGNADIGGGFNDDPLWLIACTYAYLAETGDFSILDEKVKFADCEEGLSLMEHLRKSINYTITHLGPHGLPLIGRADWNDCLNLNCFSTIPNESFQTASNFESGKAESVFIAGMFVKYGKEFAAICHSLKLYDEEKQVLAHVDAMEACVNEHGWDGEWFVRAYDAFSNPVGSNVCEEGKIFIEPQGMCVMAGIGVNNGKAQLALSSTKRYLQTKYGIVLLQPAYSKYHLELGEVSSYPPGYKENAGIFCHNNPWVSCAFATIKDGENAFEVYKAICPAYIEDISEIHRTEPYVFSQMIAGIDAPNFGEAKNSWLTGTSAWTLVNATQFLLGVIPTLNGLKLDPCLPNAIDEFKCQRKYRDVIYDIKATRGKQYCLQVNGEKVHGNTIEYCSDNKIVKIELTYL